MKKIFRSKLVIVLAVALSLINGFFLFSQSIRLDEAQSIWVSTKPILGIISFVATDVHVPLYGILLHFWMVLFGTNIIVVRAMSFLFFFLSILSIYELATRASNSRVGLLTAVLFALSPFIVWYSNEARMYTLFTFVATLHSIFFLSILGSNGRRGKFGYFLTTLIGFYTHYFFIFLLATQGAFLLIQLFTRRIGKEEIITIFEEKRHVIRAFVMSAGPAFLLFVPWIAYVISIGNIVNSEPLIPPPTSYSILQTLVLFLFGFQNQILQAIVVSLWPLFIVTLFFVFTRRDRVATHNLMYFVLVSFFPILLTFVVSFIKPIFLTRYLIFVTPSLFYLIALMLLSYPKKVSRIVTMCLVGVMVILLTYQNVSASTPVKENYEGVAEYVSQKATPEDIIAASAPFTIYPLEYGYTGRARIDTIPHWDRFSTGAIPAYSDKKLQAQLKEYEKQYNRLFVILSYDQGYESKITKYLDTHLKRLELKVFSPKLELRVYQLRYE